MRIPPRLKSEVSYARDIVKAGMDATSPEPAADLARASQSALWPAALGGAMGFLIIYLGRRGARGKMALLDGLVGGALGFAGGVAWGTRQHTRVYYQKAAHNVQAVRDAHWLKKNPVAYA
jgi:hypothetical protein